MNVKRSAVLLPAIAAFVALVVGGCSNTTTGSPTGTLSSGQPVVTGSSDSAGATSGVAQGGSSDGWWKSIDSCGMLDQASGAPLGFPNAGKPDIHSDSQNSCAWESSSASMQIVLTSQSYDSILANNGQLSDLTISGRPAKQDYNAGGGQGQCDLAVQATKGSRALILVDVAPAPTDQACQLARGVANAIAPKLPNSSG